MLENAVVGNERNRILEQLRHTRVEPVGNVGEQFQRHILMHAAGPEIGRMHPRARSAFVKVHAVFAQLVHPQRGRHRADVEDMRTKVQHVVADAR